MGRAIENSPELRQGNQKRNDYPVLISHQINYLYNRCREPPRRNHYQCKARDRPEQLSLLKVRVVFRARLHPDQQDSNFQSCSGYSYFLLMGNAMAPRHGMSILILVNTGEPPSEATFPRW